MLLQYLLPAVELLVSRARHCFDYVDSAGCLKHLVNLRELLNEHPELEAGGALESAESSSLGDGKS